MKRIKYYLAALVASGLLLSSCSDSFFDINVSPNDPAVVTPNLVLPSAISGSAYVMGGYYQAVGGFWSQQYAQAPAASQWAEWESYNLDETDFDRQFTSLYAGSLYDYEYVRKSAAASENWSYYSIATVMQAYTFMTLADLYDKVPFTEALKGVAIQQPRYDDGAVIYDSLLARIDKAMSKDFTARTSEAPGTSDVIFGGTMANWQKFANTLKLQIYLRYVNVDANKYKTQILALLAANNFLTSDAKFSAFKKELTGGNPFWNTFGDRLTGNVVANNTLMTFLNDSIDPRKAKLFRASETGATYKAMATGDSRNHSTETIKNYATPTLVKDTLAPVYFFSKEEALFLVAEAQARYGTFAAAQTAFNAGVNASLVSLGLATGSKTYTYTGIKSIMEQKWIAATNKRSIESFFDYNRTGYPAIFTQSSTSVLNGSERPQRFFFPTSERKANANTPAKVALTVKVWWGK
jgi:hypothetical protein